MKVKWVFPILLLSFNVLLAQKICTKNDCNNGFGACEFANLGSYSGQFKDGLPHGSGKFIYSNGHKYLGEWKKGKKDGIGKYLFPSGVTYEGEFQDDFFDGKGKMIFKDKSYHDGNWKRGRRHGPGILYLNSGEKIQGDWQNGQLQTDWSHLAFKGHEGLLKNCNDQYCDGIQGKYQYQDGKKFLGDFKQGTPNGLGTVYYPNGDLYEGNWKANKPNGKGTMYYAEGKSLGAVWENGKPKQKLFSKDSGKNQSATAKQVKIWAVIVGAANYQNMRSLDYTDDDAKKIHQFLISPKGGNLPDSQIELLLNQEVTREKVLSATKRIFSQADKNDAILFYFSGHGVKDAFLSILSDGNSHKINHKDIRHFINSSKAKHKLVIADACHAGTFSYSPGSMAAFLQRYYDAFDASVGGIALLMSSRGDEYSYEDQRLNSGIFSHYLIEGLGGKADENGDGLITIEEAFHYVREEVAVLTRDAQNPTLSGTYDKNMPIAIVEN